MEIYEEHFKIGTLIRDIHDKLDRGVAIIALQKRTNSDFGSGGEVTLQKSRLYVNLDNGEGCQIAKIIKAKNWESETNPNYLQLEYWIKNKGVCIEPKGNWLRDFKKTKDGFDKGESAFDSGLDHQEWEVQ